MKAISPKTTRKTPRKLYAPDLTAFIDLGFLMTTFFFFTIYLAKPTTMKLNMPKNYEESGIISCGKLSNTFTIILGKDNRIFWHQNNLHDLAESNLKETDFSSNGIRRIVSETRKNALDSAAFTVVIKPSNESNFKNTVDVLDEMAIANIRRYTIVDISTEEELAYKKSIVTKSLVLN
jgi:biopolymer transport protein ExbD